MSEQRVWSRPGKGVTEAALPLPTRPVHRDRQPRVELQYDKESIHPQKQALLGCIVISLFLAVFAFGVVVAS